MTLFNQIHIPGFFLSTESHLIGFCKSYKMALAIEKDDFPASPNNGRWLTGAWPIPAYDTVNTREEAGVP